MAKIPLRGKKIDTDPVKKGDALKKYPFETTTFREEDGHREVNPFEGNSPFRLNDDDIKEPMQTEGSGEEDIFGNSFEGVSDGGGLWEDNKQDVVTITTSIDLEVDPDLPYFFVFGNSTAGKSAMLSGLLYYMKTSGIGILNSLSENDKKHHRKGDATLQNMIRKVDRGEFIEGTQTLDPTSFVFPTEINLEFQHKNGVSMPFCLLEMAGENLKEIELSNDGESGGEFDKRIKAYLEHPNCNMIFICVVDIDDPKTSQYLIDNFLTYIQKLGRTENPVLITINKWDKVGNSYTGAEEYIDKNMSILKSRLEGENREMYYMGYSIGEVFSESTKDVFEYNPKDSKKLFEWMYEISTGMRIAQKPQKSVFGGVVGSIKNLFSNE